MLAQKTELSKEDYKKKSDELRKKVASYQTGRRAAIDKIAKKRSDARQKLLDKLDPILKSYMAANQISIIIDKKNVILGVDALDITKNITENLNKELPSLNLK